MKPTPAYENAKRLALTLVLGLTLLSVSCASNPVPVPLPELPSKPSVSMPRASSEISQSAEQKLQRWQTRQQERLTQLMRSANPGPTSPSGAQPPAPSTSTPRN